MQRGLYESPDIQAAVQQAIMQGINPGVLRGIEGGTLHFVTVQRSGDQEYIDHSLLNPEYMTAHIQNGMLINMVPATPDQIAQYEQLPELVNQHDETIEDSGTRYVEVSQPPQYIEQKLVIPDQLGHTEVNSMSIPQNDNELVTYIQCVPHTGQQIIQTNEAQVIKQNNQIPPLTPLTRSQPKRSVKTPKNVNSSSNLLPLASDAVVHKLYGHQSDSDGENESGGGAGAQQRRNRGRPKKLVNLPHKKRISNKLKDDDQPKKKTIRRTPPKQPQLNDEPQHQQILNTNQNTFGIQTESVNVREYLCEECEHKSYSQFSFYLHLKLHYEPNDAANEECADNQMISATQDEISEQMNADDAIEEYEVGAADLDDDSSRECKYTIVSPVKSTKKRQDLEPAPVLEEPNEFSDHEDMLEGIRGTVDQLQQSVDNDINHEAATNWFKNEPTNTIEHKPIGAYIVTTDQLQEDLEPSIATGILRQHLMNNKTNSTNEIIMMSVDAMESPEKKYLGSTTAVTDKKAKKAPRTVASQMNEFIEESDLVSSDDEDDSKSKKKRKSFKCRICEKVCNSKNSLHYHFLSHTGERPHQCDICGKGFFAAGALKVHNRLHSGAKPYSCDVCGRAFRQWGDLKYHIVSLHTDAKQHQCEFCGKEFSRRYSLVLHRRIHTGERNYKCEFCDKTFRASSYLQDHRRIHTGEKPHPCEICGKKFRIRSDLKRHKNIHTRATPGRSTKVAKAKLKNTAALIDNSDVVMEHSSDGMLIKIEMEQRDGLVARENDEPVSYVTNTTR